MAKFKTIDEIQKKLDNGTAVVLTATELSAAIRDGQRFSFEELDVVTTATCGLMSGTYALFSFPFKAPNSFVRAEKVLLNGIEAYPGPCPNERLGLLDLILFGTRHSISDPRYGGGAFFSDLLSGRMIHVEVKTGSGRWLEGETRLDEMEHAVLFGSRHAFRNYVGFVNPGKKPVTTIFCSSPLPPEMAGATACGCGEINPLQKDPGLDTIGVGTRVLVNGAEGYVIGPGTRSSPARPNLSVRADMRGMLPEYTGSFMTGAGPEVIQTWAVPIPVINEKVFNTVLTLDEDIPLPITDIRGRAVIEKARYSDLWRNTSLSFSFEPEACSSKRKDCPDCPPAIYCPTGAFTDGAEKIDQRRCFHCGLCFRICHFSCFTGSLGDVLVGERRVPVLQRLSDRVRAAAASADLKKRLLENRFRLSSPVAGIVL